MPAGGGVMYRCTPLGGHLSSLPLDTRLGKMLLLAALTRCLDPLLTAAAALSLGASVFSAPRDRQQEASFLQREAYGQTRSDQLAAAAAYRGWCDARAAGKARLRSSLGRQEEQDFSLAFGCTIGARLLRGPLPQRTRAA